MSCSWIRRHNTVQSPVSPDRYTGFTHILKKFQKYLFLDTGKIILKSIWKHKGSGRANAVLERNEMGGISTFHLKPVRRWWRKRYRFRAGEERTQKQAYPNMTHWFLTKVNNPLHEKDKLFNKQ